MEKCPKCHNYTYAYDRINNRFICLNIKCNHVETVNPSEYKRKNNILEKLAT